MSGPSHDAFVRWNMNDTTTARSFFELFLDPAVCGAVDLSALRVGKTDAVDEELKEIRSDLLFHVPINGKAAGLGLLIEHKSQGAVDKRCHTLPFQLRRNELRIMEALWRNHEGALYPAVHSLGLYHGHGPYRGPMSVADSIEDTGGLTPPHWQHRIQLIDLSLLKDRDLMNRGRLGLFLLVLKHIYDQDFMTVLNRLKVQIQEVDKNEEGAAFMEVMFRYIIEARKIEDVGEVKEFAMKTLRESTGEKVMTIAEGLKAEAVREVAMNMLECGVDLAIIVKCTGMSIEEVESLAHDTMSAV